MRTSTTVILLGIPFALWGIVASTFTWLGVSAGNDYIFYLGYAGVAMGSFLSCKLAYQKGRLDQKRIAEPAGALNEGHRAPGVIREPLNRPS